MPSVTVSATSRGASLITIARELASMDDAKVTGIFQDAMQAAAAPFVGAVRAAALAIPVKGEVPYHQPPGLRARIAECAEMASWTDHRSASVVVEIEPSHMPSGQMSLPLGMEGAKRWRHPIFGNREHWVTQEPHPFFYQAAAGFGPAAGVALEAALEEITSQISG